MSAEMLAREREAADVVSETTPVSLSPALEEFCLTLGGDQPVFVPVVDDPHGMYGWCNDGVAEKIKVVGGSIAFGWTVWEWPDVLWTAEFHAVWRSSEGKLFDITPKPNGERRILFVADQSYSENFSFNERPGNRRRRAYQPANPAKASMERIATLKPSQVEYERKRAEKAGLSLQQWFEAKIPKDTLALIIDEMIAACDDHEAYFDTLGVSGEIQVDDKLARLMRRRIAAQMALKRALAMRS